MVRLADWADHDALGLEEAAVFLDFFLFYARTVAEALGEDAFGARELTWLG